MSNDNPLTNKMIRAMNQLRAEVKAAENAKTRLALAKPLVRLLTETPSFSTRFCSNGNGDGCDYRIEIDGQEYKLNKADYKKICELVAMLVMDEYGF